MISLNKLLDMVATEAIEGEPDREGNLNYRTAPESNLPPIQYDLELIEENGHLNWVE